MILQPAQVELTKVRYYDRHRDRRDVPAVPTISRGSLDGGVCRDAIIKRNVFGHRWVLKINEQEKESKVDNPKNLKVVVYVLVFCCIIVAVCFGFYFSFEHLFWEQLPSISDEKNITIQTNTSISEPAVDDSASSNHPKLQALPLPTNQPTQATSDETRETEEDYKQPVEEEDERHEDEYDDEEEERPNYTREEETSRKPHICYECLDHDEICLKTSEEEPPKCFQPLDRRDPTGCGGLCRINTQYCKVLDSETEMRQCMDTRSSLKCPQNTFNCGNRCIAALKRCDGIFDCSNYSDEENCVCDMESHFHCGNGTSCLDKRKKCDGKIDCWDKTDELSCNRDCTEHQLPCHNGQCIEIIQFCDGNYDCYDKSDEPWGCRK